MANNIFWGFTFITVGTLIILNKIYGVAVPFEVIVGLFFIISGMSKLFNAQGKCSL
jgi:hypothetical protein